jgi:dienelactone hydrolase
MRTWVWSLLTLFALHPASGLAAVSGKLLTYEIDGQSYEGYFVSPSRDAPLVLLIHDWDGLTDYEVKRADMLAEMGYAVFAADLFGAGVRPTKVEDRRQHTGELYKDRTKMRALMTGALDTAAAMNANVDNAVAMGYCFGGAAVLELARSGIDLKGFATFHGGLKTPEGQDYSKTRKAGVKHQMVTYSGAPHAFTVFGGERYREDADRKSWDLFSRFLAEKLR